MSIEDFAEAVRKESRISLTTLCYLEADGCYLMMHRVKKEKDINKDKWIGIGGHVERGESPDECLLREVKEETGLTLTQYAARGIVTFIYKDTVEYMHLYTANGFADHAGRTGLDAELADCDEGELSWVPIEQVPDLPIWEGDKIFFRLLKEREDYFSLKLVYSDAGELVEAKV